MNSSSQILKPSGSKHKLFVYIVGLTAALSGLLFGIDAGVISGALSFIKNDFNLTTGSTEMVVTAILIGAIIGALASSFISRKYGRHFSLVVSAAIFSIGALLSATAINVNMLILVRIFLGIGLGIASSTAPVYLSEMAPKSIRGRLITVYQFMITLGILIAYLSDAFLISYSYSWRWMLGITFFPAFLMFLCVLTLPKSPRWLVLLGKVREARSVLSRIRNHDEIEDELAEIRNTFNQSAPMASLLKSRQFMKVLCLGMILQIIQQMSGINAVIYYAPKIFQYAGFSTDTQQMWATVLVGLVNMLVTIVSIAYIDKLGRKPILYFGLLLTSTSMLCLGYLFHIGLTTVFAQYFAVALVLIFVCGFATSLGPIIWILCAEIYPLRVREIGMTVATVTNWVFNAIVGGFFLTVVNSIGIASTFVGLSILSYLSLIFIIGFCPETKGVSLEKIESNLMAGNSCRKLGG
ncbi:MAG: sugar porter family MFS transporter [Pseudomonadota bacterium]